MRSNFAPLPLRRKGLHQTDSFDVLDVDSLDLNASGDVSGASSTAQAMSHGTSLHHNPGNSDTSFSSPSMPSASGSTFSNRVGFSSPEGTGRISRMSRIGVEEDILYGTNTNGEYSRESGAGLDLNEYGMNMKLNSSVSATALNNLNNLIGTSPRLSQTNQELAPEVDSFVFYDRHRKRTVTAVDMDTLYDLPQSLLPHTKHVSRFRRFGRGQVFGYCLFFILCVAFLTVLVAFLVIDQRADTTGIESPGGQLTDVCLDSGGADNPLCQESLTTLGGQAGIASTLTRHIFDYVFLVIAFVVTLVLFGTVRGLRELRKGKLIDALPGDSIDLWQLNANPDNANRMGRNKKDKRSVQSLRSHQICFNTPMLLSIRDEFQRVIVLQKLCKELPKRLGQKPGDDNWGRNEDGSCYHYQTSISLSYRSLEEFARKYDPALAMGKKESVRAYVERIKRKCTGIDPNVCDQYVRIYEEAKFGSGRDFNRTKYEKFRQDFANIIKFFISRKRSA